MIKLFRVFFSRIFRFSNVEKKRGHEVIQISSKMLKLAQKYKELTGEGKITIVVGER
jgi:hypothetical protein